MYEVLNTELSIWQDMLFPCMTEYCILYVDVVEKMYLIDKRKKEELWYDFVKGRRSDLARVQYVPI